MVKLNRFGIADSVSTRGDPARLPEMRRVYLLAQIAISHCATDTYAGIGERRTPVVVGNRCKLKGDSGLLQVNLRCVYGEYTERLRRHSPVRRNLTANIVKLNRSGSGAAATAAGAGLRPEP
jgi:hypothetical protein